MTKCPHCTEPIGGPEEVEDPKSGEVAQRADGLGCYQAHGPLLPGQALGVPATVGFERGPGALLADDHACSAEDVFTGGVGARDRGA